MKSCKITVVDDEKDILDLLKYNFEQERAIVKTFTSGLSAFSDMQENIPDIILSDWMMEDIDGLELCRKVKMDPVLRDVPFVMLTARCHETDVVTALEMGAEDFMVKPIRIKELIARLKKISRRNKNHSLAKQDLHNMPTSESQLITYREITMNIDKHKVFVEGKPVDLTYSEYKILQLLIIRKGKVYSRNQIIEKLNGQDHLSTERSVDVQVVGLRRKIGKLRNYLQTVRGVGYRMMD